MSNPFHILLIKPYVAIPNQSIDVPLGIISLSAFLRKHFGNQVTVDCIDLRLHKNPKKTLLNKLKQRVFDLVGISMLSFEHSFLDETLPIIKQHASKARIIIGGPYATSQYEHALRHSQLCCVVIGEGEIVLCKLIERWTKNKDIFDIKGIAYRDGEKFICNQRELYIDELDNLPFPDYDQIDLTPYWRDHHQMNVILAESRYMPVMSSRACPYQCIYCHDMFGKKFRKKSPKRFVDELKLLYFQHNVREFHIIDDAFNIDRKRLHQILHLIIDSGMNLRLSFPNALRGDVLEKEDIDLLKESGAYMLTLAVESASKRIQKLMGKNLNIQKVMDNIDYASTLGLITNGYFMLGFPTETLYELKQTIDLAINSSLDMVSFHVVVPFPGTGLYELALKEKPDYSPDHSGRYLGSSSFYQYATGINVLRYQQQAYLSFYQPIRLLRLFSKVPRKMYFLERFFWAGLGVFKA
ncbi:radical SAM domain-containing protein [Candidatus Magnetomorum sp. HK-1]|nr:radical SAM domain-containing protein [Candidatus Magnetomorum sp. HK-1]